MNDPWRTRRKIIPLPGASSAGSLTATLIDKIQQGQVRHIIQVITWNDGSVSVAWDDQKSSDLVFGARALDDEIRRVMTMGRDPEGAA